MASSSLAPAYLMLGVQALLPIVLGSFKSLKTPRSTVILRKQRSRGSVPAPIEDDEAEEEAESLEETLGWVDSLAFPIIGSVVLLGLWALLKYVGKEWIDLFLGIYFSGAGVFAMQTTLSSIVAFVLRQTRYNTPTYHIRITSNLKQIYHLSLKFTSVLVMPLSVIVPALYIPLGRPYIISNLLALSLATATLALLRLDSFLTAFLLLGGLLVYDIFWVFATPVMVTVAKGIDAPIKILAPKSPLSTSPMDFAMLGLGDIVVPGLVIALCLRFDMHRHVLTHPKEEVTPHTSFSRVYFWTAMASYVIGLGTTMGVMHWFQHAQPALLYLSPACTFGPLLLAAARGEVKLLWSFSDSPEEDKEGEAKRDETIEAPSEAAMQARQAVADGKAEELAEEVAEHVEEEDDSWMDGQGVAGATEDTKPRRRRKTKKA